MIISAGSLICGLQIGIELAIDEGVDAFQEVTHHAGPSVEALELCRWRKGDKKSSAADKVAEAESAAGFQADWGADPWLWPTKERAIDYTGCRRPYWFFFAEIYTGCGLNTLFRWRQCA